MQSSFVSEPKTIKRFPLISVYFRLPRLDYLLWGREGKNLRDLCLQELMLMPDAVLKMTLHPGGPPHPLCLHFGKRATCRQAATLRICLFPPTVSFSTEACQALSEADWLYLLFELVDASAGCWYVAWEITLLLNLFSKPLPLMNHAWPVLWNVWRLTIKEPCFSLPASVPSFAPELAFFVTQRRGVNNTCLVVGNDVSTVLLWRRCVRWLTGAPPCGKPIPCSSLWSHAELRDLSKFRHGAPCEWFELGVKSSSVLCAASLPKCCVSQWKRNETAAELISPYLLISSSLAKILQRLFSLRYSCEVQQKLKCMLSSGPKSCIVLTDTKGVPELQQLILSTLCAMGACAVFHFLELEESGD